MNTPYKKDMQATILFYIFRVRTLFILYFRNPYPDYPLQLKTKRWQTNIIQDANS